ncbi:MAG TPA: TonB-dependent receptor [Gemmatimonadales bacterium]|jgi:iron complex outermembrane receptor protein
MRFRLALLLCIAPVAFANAQEVGTVTGTVTRAADGGALSSVSVSVAGAGISTITGADGRYTLRRVPAGQQTIVFRWLGYAPTDVPVVVEAGRSVTADAALEAVVVSLGEIVVEGASRGPERIVEAPAAISVVPQEQLQSVAITGQAPMALQSVPGVDIVQSGVNDFNVNARGFNSTLNRRVLTLQDGRDLAIAFLGAQEWNGMTQSTDDLGKVEMVRGPGSALYGANAFSGVINITTPEAREVVGNKLTVAGGELETFRVDGRHASLLADGRIGVRLNGGYNRSDTWSRSRTERDGTSLQEEYADATDEPVPFTVEALPLKGQTADPVTGVVSGDRDPLRNVYGSGRVDYYLDNGSVFTLDGGAARVENEIFVTGIGRVQVDEAIKPYARAAFAAERFNVFGYWNSRTSLEPQFSLTSGLPLEERSDIFHVEGQNNWNFNQDRGRVVYGASYRNTKVNTSGTLMNLANDDRSDDLYSAYGQVEYRITPQVRLVGAARFDDGDLIDGQFSPKGAVVFSPNENHSFRFSVNRAFQTPNYSEFFLQVPVAPASGRQLESGIEAYYAAVRANVPPPALLGLTITDNLPWEFNPLATAFALGNSALEVEKVTGWELGYKGTVGERVYVTVDGYINRLSNFVTDLLPRVNPVFAAYGLTDEVDVPAELAALDARLTLLGLPPEHPLRAPIPVLLAGYGQLDAGTRSALSTLPDGSRAAVFSYTNAGRVTERGIEIGLGYQFTPEIRGDVSFTGFSFDVDEDEQALGDQLLPNTPSKKGTLSLSYAGQQGIDGNVTLRLSDGYEWATGVFQGYVPSSELLNLSAGYRINNYVRIHATATNVFDQQRFQMFGGSVIGRRVLGGVTANF